MHSGSRCSVAVSDWISAGACACPVDAKSTIHSRRAAGAQQGPCAPPPTNPKQPHSHHGSRAASCTLVGQLVPGRVERPCAPPPTYSKTTTHPSSSHTHPLPCRSRQLSRRTTINRLRAFAVDGAGTQGGPATTAQDIFAGEQSLPLHTHTYTYTHTPVTNGTPPAWRICCQQLIHPPRCLPTQVIHPPQPNAFPPDPYCSWDPNQAHHQKLRQDPICPAAYHPNIHTPN